MSKKLRTLLIITLVAFAVTLGYAGCVTVTNNPVKNTTAINIKVENNANNIMVEFIDRYKSNPGIIVDYYYPDAEQAENGADESSGYAVNPVSEINGRVQAAEGDARQYNSTRRVVCFGDSVTEGTGGDGVTMPGTLEKLSGATVLNYGVFGETASCIAARMGANPQYLIEDIVIPADSTPVRAQCSGKYGWEMLLVFGDAGVNNVFIDGIEGKYYMEGENRVFSRITPGEEKAVSEGTQLITHAMADKRPDDIIVIWAGNNDVTESVDEIPLLIQKINEMIEYAGTSEYIVVGEIPNHSFHPMVTENNDVLRETYGEHFLDMRDYLMYHALDALGIEPDDEDKEAIANGDIPWSIKTDENHGNSNYYALAGEQVFKKLVELGYLKQ